MNIANYLPKKIEHYFSGIIAEYLYKLYHQKLKIIEKKIDTEEKMLYLN